MIKKLTSDDINYIEQIFNLEKEIFKSSGSKRLQNFLRRYYDNEIDIYSI